jgi:HSP20 family protein
MNIVRWEPFGEMVSLRNAMDRLFEDSFVRWAGPLEGDTATPAVDIFETAEKLGVRASLPGIKPEDVDISITPEGVVIKGETREEAETKEGNYVRRECHYGTFSRTIALPQGLKVDKAEATMENGVLTLEIPKAAEEKPKTVKVKTRTEPKKLETKETKEVKS